MSVVTFALFTDSYRESLYESSRKIAWDKISFCHEEDQSHVFLLMAYDFLCKLDKVTAVTYLHHLIQVDPEITRNTLGVTIEEQALVTKEAYDEWVHHTEQLDIQSYLAHTSFAVKLGADLLSTKKDYELLVRYDMPLHTLKLMRVIAKTIYREWVR